MRLPLKLNPAGALFPTLIVSWQLSISVQHQSIGNIAPNLLPGRIGYVAVSVILIVGAVVLYTAFLVNPERWASDLQQQGASVEAPDRANPPSPISTTSYRVWLLRAVFISQPWPSFPDLLIAHYRLPFYFDGASLLIVVCALLDMQFQVKSVARRSKGRT